MAIFARILVPFDGSPAADRALDVARRLASESGGAPATVLVCHAADLSSAVSVTDRSADPASLAPIDQYRAEAQALVDAAVSGLALAGIPAEGMVLDGHPVDAIVRFAQQWKPDAIVMGSHGRSGVARLVLGSTAEGVLRHADVPVVVVRDPHDAS